MAPALKGGGGGGGVAGVLRTSPSNCKAHVKLSSRRVLKGETKVLVKIRAQMATKIPPLGLVMECKMCSSMPLIKCCLWGKRSRSGQVSLKEERQMYGEISCKRFILVTGRRFWTICSRGEERWLLSPAGTAACKRDLNPHLLELICVSWGQFWKEPNLFFFFFQIFQLLMYPFFSLEHLPLQ